MSRRWLLFPVLLLALTAWAAPAPAHGLWASPATGSAEWAAPVPAAGFAPLWSQPVSGPVRLIAGDGATLVWAAQESGGSRFLARTYDRAGHAQGSGPVVLADGIAGLGDWLVASNGTDDLVLVWKSEGTTTAKTCTVGGTPVWGPTTVCTDAAVAALRGAGATATPAALMPDGAGGAYVLLRAAPTAPTGDSLLQHVSSDGTAALPDPGLAIQKGTASGAAVDDDGHLYALLGSPGRNGVAVQRFAPDGTADWAVPVTPYNPLVENPPATPETPLAMTAGFGGTAIWRESDAVKAQRFSASGGRFWLHPAGIGSAGRDTQVTGDGDGGVYVAGTTSQGLSVQHITGSAAVITAPGGSVAPLNMASPHVDALCPDAAGDLDVAYSDGSSGGAAGVARMTFLGVWSTPSLGGPAATFTALVDDGTGGAYGVSGAPGATLWRLGETGAAVTLCPRAASVVYGKTFDASGYLTLDGEPLAGVTVTVSPAAAAAGGVLRPSGDAPAATTPVTAVTDAHGFYEVTVTPAASAAWTATATGPAGQTIVSGPTTPVAVAFDVTLKLKERRAGRGYVEVFSGEVDPSDPGGTVLVQRQTGDTWLTIATAKLDGGSTYSVKWPLPLRPATYYFRAVAPADADHAEGVSRTARLKVVIKRG